MAVSLGLSAFAHGQNNGNDSNIEEISVTGSRIMRSGVDTPTPVTTVTAAELDRAAPGNLIDSLTTLPQFFGNITPEQVTGGQNSGGSNVNLRGAGVNRTLVLLDGRRVVPSNRFGTVDVSVFPEALVERVETITGGASASYGTDAVAGVVNFILDTDYEGFKAHSQWGTTRYNDGDNYEIGFAFGHRFDNGLHVLAAYETFDRDRINSFDSLSDRSYYQQRARITNPDPNGPTEIIRPFVSPTNYTNGGIINQSGSALNKVEFLPDGSTQMLPFSGVGQLIGGCNCQAEPTQTYGVDGDNEIQSGFERDSLFLRANYDISPDLSVFGQVLYGNTVVADRRESIALLGPWSGQIFVDNPYLPDNIRQTMVDENLESFGFGYFARNTPDSPLGESFHETDNEFTSTTLGFDMRLSEGGFLGGWQVSGYYDYGENTQDFIANNAVRVDRLPMAMDAVDNGSGSTVCRVTLFNPGVFDDCVPLDMFGGVDNIDPAARAFVMDVDNKVARQETKQQFAEIVLTGEVWDGLEAGPVFGAFGGSWRKQELAQRTVDPSDEFPATTDGTLLSELGLNPEGLRGVLPEDEGGVPGLRHVPSGFKGDANSSSVLFSSLREITGEFDVKELFGELNIPLLSGHAMAQQLELDLAARWADYEGSGSIWAWKAGISWQVSDEWRIRATQSRDVRAATLQERFDQTRGGTNVLDPERNNALTTTASFSGGNENVNPEEADTTTIGAVYQPVWLEGFSASLDWYDIDVSDAIAQLSSQNVVDGCFEGDTSLCAFILRDPVSNEIVRVDNLFINLANQRISGMDLELNYSFPVSIVGGDEQMSWRFFGTWLEENSIKNPDAPRDDRVGQLGGGFGLPEYKLTTNLTYTNGPVTAYVQGRWIDSGILDRFRTEGVDIDDNTVSSVFYTDLNLSYTGRAINDRWEWQAFLNVTNLFDEEPPQAPGTVGRTGTNEFNAGLHDVLGRRYVAGLRVSF